jgi:hypothetical protein
VRGTIDREDGGTGAPVYRGYLESPDGSTSADFDVPHAAGANTAWRMARQVAIDLGWGISPDDLKPADDGSDSFVYWATAPDGA